ncbi:hypothetical protein CFOL_v3_17771, partial [Cephalotus follicularis]
DVLHNFAEVSGMQPNLDKCQIFYGNVDSVVRNRASNLLHISEGSLPIRYLGLPLLASKLSYKDCKVLLDKLTRRTSSWMSNSLSFGGRLQLMASVLFSIQVFWGSTFILPVAVTKECDRIMRNFLWHGTGKGKKSGKVAWNKVCKPKKEGGLGFVGCRVWNQAATMKLGWEICQKKASIWTDWCYTVFLKENNFWAAKVSNNSSWSWRNVLKSRNLLANNLHYEVGDGMSLSLWYDPWLNGVSLVDRYGERVIQDSVSPRLKTTRLIGRSSPTGTSHHLYLQLGPLTDVQ